MGKSKWSVLMVALGAGLVVAPFGSIHCPMWQVIVVDEAGSPVSGITVRMSYQTYSAEDKSHEVDKITDEHGQASFEAHTLQASLIRRCYYSVLSARAGVHASFGPNASVFAFGKGVEGFDVDPRSGVLVSWTGTPNQMQSRIVVKRTKG